MQDFFDAVAYWDRLLLLRVQTEELLRKPTGRTQRRRQERLLVDAQHQLRSQMAANKRRAFRGDVAVDLSIHASGQRSVPASPRVVKRYLDAMNGIVYADDRQVAHLTVHRFADDWPGLSRWPQGPANENPSPWVDLFVTPVRVSGCDWDRGLALLEGEQWQLRHRHEFSIVGNEDHDLQHAIEGLVLESWSDEDEDRLREVLEEFREDHAGCGPLHLLPTDLAAGLREMAQSEATMLVQKLILDQTPGRADHPGAGLTRRGRRYAELGLDALDLDAGRDRYELPGRFWLPLRSDQPSWPEAVRDAMERHLQHWRVLDRAFDQPLSLDIGAFGLTDSGRDVDNLARVVLTEFEQRFCGESRGTVVSYRAYRRPAAQPGIRVLVMGQGRMQQISAVVDEARSAVISRGMPNADDDFDDHL